MPINFDDLLDDKNGSVVDPRDVFLTLNRSKEFAFPRDIQTEVMKAWFGQRNQADTVIKLNVGSGKTLVGLMLLQSSLNEGVGPALYIAPDKQLVDQVLREAEALGIDATDDPKDAEFQSGGRIVVTTVHRLFNGRSIFGIGADGVKLKIGTIVVDDAHACIATITDQFRIRLNLEDEAFKEIVELLGPELKRQSHPRFLSITSNDPQALMEVPFWAWTAKHDRIIELLHKYRNTESLRFSYPLLSDILPQCRCLIGGQGLEIEPVCPPTDLIRSFSKASRKIYMTATLADDSVLVTHFGAQPDKLTDPIVPTSSQSMGERMILMPQELNPEIELADVQALLADLAKTVNVVVIAPSAYAATHWQDIADQTLDKQSVVEGVERLKQEHVGLTVLVNRYDGIDLPHDACRVLVIAGLPEVASYSELSDMAVLSDSTAGLRRQMQRIEQGMGRGVRSNDDYCVVLLIGPKLIRRVMAPDGLELLTPATRAQLELSRNLAKQLAGVGVPELRSVLDECLERNPSWVNVSKKALLGAMASPGLALDKRSIDVRRAFDLSRAGDHKAAAEVLGDAASESDDDDEKALLLAKRAAAQHHIDPAAAQKTLLAAYRLNPNVIKPLEGVAHQSISPIKGEQAAIVQDYHRSRFLEATDRLLYANELVDDLAFTTVVPDRFESAIDSAAKFIGIQAQRPERLFGEGPDNLWALSGGSFLVIECKNTVTSTQGISKTDLGQLDQAVTWFSAKYPAAEHVPVIIHPLRVIGDTATPVSGMRIITEPQLAKLRKAIGAFAKSLCDLDTLNNTAKVKELIDAHGFNSNEFVNRYTVGPK